MKKGAPEWNLINFPNFGLPLNFFINQSGITPDKLLSYIAEFFQSLS